jgi:hypothetical protein
MMVIAAACIGAGAAAGLGAFATELHWPLSDINFGDAVRLGLGWGVVGAVVAACVLSVVERKHLWIAAATTVGVTWLTTYAAIWWMVVCALG